MRAAYFGIYFLILFWGCLGTSLPAQSQIVNIEDARRGRDSLNHVAGKVGVNFSIFNQNAGKNRPNNYLQFTFNGDAAYHTPLHTYLFFNYLNYLLVNYDTQSQRKTVAQQGYVHFRVNLWQAKRVSYELFTQAQSDKARGLQWRTLGGGYLRWRIMKQEDKNVTVFLGTGLMHEHEEWENPEQMNRLEVSNLLKSTSYASAKLKLQNNVEANTIVYYQVGYSKLIDDFRNRVSGEISLGVKLSKLLALRTKFNCTYEDRPIVPVTRFVYSIVNGIEVVF